MYVCVCSLALKDIHKASLIIVNLYTNSGVSRRQLEADMWLYKCSKCNNTPIYNQKEGQGHCVGVRRSKATKANLEETGVQNSRDDASRKENNGRGPYRTKSRLYEWALRAVSDFPTNTILRDAKGEYAISVSVTTRTRHKDGNKYITKAIYAVAPRKTHVNVLSENDMKDWDSDKYIIYASKAHKALFRTLDDQGAQALNTRLTKKWALQKKNNLATSKQNETTSPLKKAEADSFVQLYENLKTEGKASTYLKYSEKLKSMLKLLNDANLRKEMSDETKERLDIFFKMLCDSPAAFIYVWLEEGKPENDDESVLDDKYRAKITSI